MPAVAALSHRAVVDRYFLEHRAKLLDLAAFLDRAERAASGGPEDFRVAALKAATALLVDGGPERARRVQEALSDPSDEPLASAAGLKGAWGAHPPGGAHSVQ